MLTTLALYTTLLAPAAPAPGAQAQAPAPAAAPINAPAAKEAAPAATSTQPPRIIELKPNKDGKVLITVMRQQQVQAPLGAPGAAPGGNPGGRPFGGPVMFNRPEQVELKDVKDLKITTAAGKEVSKDDAIKALDKGGRVVVSADGKNVSADFLKMFKDEVLVLASPELVGGANAVVGGGGIIIQGGPQGWIIPANGPRVPAPAPEPKPAPKVD